MKKLLVLVLVLGISSIVNAGSVDLRIVSYGDQTRETGPIDATTEIEVVPSDWVDIDVLYFATATENLTSMSFDIILTGMATLDLTEPTEPPVWDAGLSTITEVVAGKQYTIDYTFNMMTGWGVEGDPAGAIALDHILVHCDGYPDTVTITLVENSQTTAMMTAEYDMGSGYMGPITGGLGAGVTIFQVPEPMTLALLGLGGLFLVRRKK